MPPSTRSSNDGVAGKTLPIDVGTRAAVGWSRRPAWWRFDARARRLVCYTGAVTDSYFQSVGSGVVPLPHAHAPWGDDMLHGRLLGGLAARALEAEHGAPGWRAARLTVDLFRPAAMALVEIDVRPVRAGRRIKVTDALMRCDGHDVGRATAVFLAESEEPPGRIWRPQPEPWPDPDSIETSGAGSVRPRRLVVPGRARRLRHR